MKQQLLEIINALTGDEYVELRIRSTVEPKGHKMVEYNFEPSSEKKVRIAYSVPVKEDVTPHLQTPPVSKDEVPESFKTSKRIRKANAIGPNPATQVSTVSTEEIPAKVDYAQFQMERAKDMVDGGDFDAAIKILEQACDADRKNKTLAEALYDAKMAKQRAAAFGAEEPTEIKIPRKQTVVAPTVAEKPTDEFNHEDSGEETF